MEREQKNHSRVGEQGDGREGESSCYVNVSSDQRVLRNILRSLTGLCRVNATVMGSKNTSEGGKKADDDGNGDDEQREPKEGEDVTAEEGTDN